MDDGFLFLFLWVVVVVSHWVLLFSPVSRMRLTDDDDDDDDRK